MGQYQGYFVQPSGIIRFGFTPDSPFIVPPTGHTGFRHEPYIIGGPQRRTGRCITFGWMPQKAVAVGGGGGFNCGILLNDGVSFILLNDGQSAILLNDNSCSAQPGPFPLPTPPVVVRGGWAPRKPWKPSKRLEKEIEELMAEMKAKAQELRPQKRRQLEASANEAHAAIELLKAQEEEEEAKAQAMRLISLMRSVVGAKSIASTMRLARQAEIMAIAMREDIDDEEEAISLLLH